MPTLSFRDFRSGLYVTDRLPMAVPPNGLLVAKNIDYVPGHDGTIKVRGRMGTKVFQPDAPLPGEVLSIYRHYPRQGTPSWLVSYRDGPWVKLKKDTDAPADGVLELVTGAPVLSEKAMWRFVNWPARGFAYGVNGEYGLWLYDGAMVEVILQGMLSGTGLELGPYITLWRGRLWFTFVPEIQYSVYVVDVVPETADVVRNIEVVSQVSVNDQQGGEIVGIEGFRDTLLIFKNTSLWAFVGDPRFADGGQLTMYSTKGCVAPRSIAPTQYGVIFVSADGVYITDGQSEPVELSPQLRPLFVGPEAGGPYTDAVGGWDDVRQRYYVRLSPNDDRVYVLHRILTAEGPTWAWSVYTIPCSAIGVASSEVDSGQVMFGTAAGKLLLLDQPTTSDIDGLAGTQTPIDLAIKTVSAPLSRELYIGRVYEVEVVYRGRHAVVVGVEYDANPADAALISVGESVPTDRLIASRRGIESTRYGKFASVHLSIPEGGCNVEIYGIDLEVKYRGVLCRREQFGQA